MIKKDAYSKAQAGSGGAPAIYDGAPIWTNAAGQQKPGTPRTEQNSRPQHGNPAMYNAAGDPTGTVATTAATTATTPAKTGCGCGKDDGDCKKIKMACLAGGALIGFVAAWLIYKKA
jgi:hypothetical protein